MSDALASRSEGETQAARPAVSVVVPCFNTHQFLGTTLASLRSQTLPPAEIIVVDDGSTNPVTIAFLDALGDEVRLLRQENRGLPGARNAGIRAAAGPFILPLDSDDWLENTAIERLHAALTSAPGAVFAFADMIMEGEVKGLLLKNYNYFEQLFFNQLPYCLMYRKETWERLGGYDEAMRKGYEDWDFNIRAGSIGDGVRVAEPLFHYRIATGGMLLAVSNRRHVDLWQTIREKNAETYRLASLLAIWRQWRSKPSTYPLAFYFIWNAVVAGLPVSLSNRLFASLRKFSQSRRTGLAEKLKAAASR